MPETFLTVVIPCFNESQRLPATLEKICEPLRRLVESFEILVVDDGSTDGTGTIAEKLRNQIPELRFMPLPKNRGKGWAVCQGMLSANARFILMTDADLSTPIEELERFLPFLKDHPIVIGTRKHREAQILQHQPVWRESMGKAFTWISNAILGLHVGDFTCGFKIFEASAARTIFSRLTIQRWAFDSEVMFLAKRFGFHVQEVPVKWANSPQTKVRIVRDTIVSFLSLWKIRWNGMMGVYD